MTASVAYGCATFFDLTFLAWGWQDEFSLNVVFVIFLVILAFITVVNIFSSHLLALINNVSVWWHVVGAAVARARADHRARPAPQRLAGLHRHLQRLRLVRRRRRAASRSSWRSSRSASSSPSTRSPGSTPRCTCPRRPRVRRKTAAKGIWQSIFYSAVGGYILLLAVTFAIPQVDGAPDYASIPAGGVAYIFDTALGSTWGGLLLFISSCAQLFCATACLTSTSRMMFAFSRDRAVPGSRYWSKVNCPADPGQRRDLRRRAAARSSPSRRSSRSTASRRRSTRSRRSRSSASTSPSRSRSSCGGVPVTRSRWAAGTTVASTSG